MSSYTSTTVKSISSTRRRTRDDQQPNRKPSAPLRQRQEKAEERHRKQEEQDLAVSEWHASTLTKANELGERFGKKPRYFLDQFYSGGARMVHHHEKVNPHNAFKSLKARELRDEGADMSLLEMQQKYLDEYRALGKEERDEIVREFKENVDITKNLPRPAPRGKIQDVSNVIRNMRELMSGLNSRVGIEGFFCIVRNNSQYHMSPQWYFTTEALANYMPMAVRKKWDTHDVGTKLEAFAIAGCDPVNLCATSKQKADYMKAQIRDKINTKLVEITQNPKAIISYTDFEEKIVLRYGVDIVGYTYDNFVNPSELSSSLPPLKALLDALNDNTCKFIKLTSSERKERETTFYSKVQSGEVEVRKRKRRADYGVRKKKRVEQDSADKGSSEGLIEDEDGEEGED